MNDLAPAVVRIVRSAASVLVCGSSMRVRDFGCACAGDSATLDPLDLRDLDEPLGEGALRTEIAARLTRERVVVLLLGIELPAGLRAILGEISDGWLNSASGGATQLPAGARVVAFTPASVPPRDLAPFFLVYLSGEEAVI